MTLELRTLASLCVLSISLVALPQIARAQTPRPFAVRVVDQDTAEEFLDDLRDGDWLEAYVMTVNENGEPTGGETKTPVQAAQDARAAERNLTAAERWTTDRGNLAEAYAITALGFSFVEPAIALRLARRGMVLREPDDSEVRMQLTYAQCEARYRLGTYPQALTDCRNAVKYAGEEEEGAIAWMARLRIVLMEPGQVSKADAERFFEGELLDGDNLSETSEQFGQLTPVATIVARQMISDIARAVRVLQRFDLNRATFAFGILSVSAKALGDEVARQAFMDEAIATDARIPGGMTPQRAGMRWTVCFQDARSGRSAQALKSCLTARKAYVELGRNEEYEGVDLMLDEIDGLLDRLGGR
ncbi:MAG: hypothetical protein QM608_06245 [Caulobacter sp.]